MGGYAVAAIGAAGIGGLALTLRAGIKEFAEAAKVGAQTNAVLASTGGIANVTAGEVSKLAEALMQKSGVDDEAIQSGENMLLTFKNIRNEVGAGNDIFSQATKTTLDFSVAMGKDLPASAILVGKALNDPIKGLTALGRVGVTFTEGQKEMIKGMVESGNVMGAQKLILQELNSEFGGSAEALGKTLPGQINILKESFSNMAGQMVGALVPAFTKVMGAASKFMTRLGEAEGLSGKLSVVWDTLRDGVSKLATVFSEVDWSGVGATLTEKLRDAISSINWAGAWAGAQGIGEGLATRIASVDWTAVGAAIGDGIAKGVENAGKVAQKVAEIINKGFQAVDWSGLGRAAGPGLATALVVAFTTLLDPAFWMKNWDLALAVALVAFTGPLGKLGAGLIAPFKKLGGDIVLGITSGIESFAPRIAKVVLDALSGLPGLITKMLGALLGPVKTGFAKLGALASFVVKILGVSAAINAIVGFARDVAAWLVKVARYFTDLRGKIMGAFAGAAGWLVGAGASILQGLWDGLKSKWEAVASWVGGLGGQIKGLKGPESKDAVLLKPEGKAIILGLETGMMESWATLAPKINALGGNIISNFIMGVSANAPQFTGKLAEAATNALEAARAVVEGFQVKLGEAFGRLGEYAKRAFEAKVKGMADGIAREFEAKIGGIKAFQASLTPAELQLQQMDKSEQERQRASALATAQAALVKAEALDAGVEKEAAVAAAKEQIRVAEAANIRVGLEEQAALERTHRDQAAALQIAFLEEAKAKELANLEERTAQQGAALEKQLGQLVAKLATHPKEYDKIQAQIIKLLNSYGISFKKSGLALGNAFAAGIRASVAEVERAAKAVAAAAAKYLPHSPAEKGPLSKPVDWPGYIMDGFANTIRMAGAAASGPLGGGGTMGAARPAAAMSGGGSGNVQHFHFPHYVGDRRELVDAVRTEVRRATARNG